MHNNNSPWLHQLKVTRTIDTLHGDLTADVAIIGAGIAGVMTAYFTLKYTDKGVLLVEGNKVAHGATGHNAGQIVFEFEKEFHTLVEEYGLELAAEAEKSVRGAWLLLEEIYLDANLATPMSSFLGYNGFATVGRVIRELKNNALRMEAGLQVFPIYIADDAPGLSEIPREYRELYNIVPRSDILALLETKDTQYVAVISERKGCVNSALLVEEIVGFMLSKYKGRFMLVEDTHVSDVILEEKRALLVAKEFTITANRVVLCTNGFEKFNIRNMAGPDINVKFHHMVKGVVGYMAGYLEELSHPPIALSFYDKKQIEGRHSENPFDDAPYFYMTRRPYEVETNETHNLVCVGGPDLHIEDSSVYVRDSEYMEGAAEDIEQFLHSTYENAPKGDIDFKFKWHGLMGYTPTSLRVVGPEPKNKVLMYNLGCNGVGILTSIFGGKKISDFLSGKRLPPSLFDPRMEYPEDNVDPLIAEREFAKRKIVTEKEAGSDDDQMLIA